MTSRQRKRLLAYVKQRVIDLGDGICLMRERYGENTFGRTFLLRPDDDTGEMICSCECFGALGACKHAALLETTLKVIGHD
jgi:hypothetical protein